MKFSSTLSKEIKLSGDPGKGPNQHINSLRNWLSLGRVRNKKDCCIWKAEWKTWRSHSNLVLSFWQNPQQNFYYLKWT